MDTNLKSPLDSQSNQTSAESGTGVRGTDSLGRAKAPVLHVQTGIRAGGILERIEHMLNKMQAAFGTNI